MFIFLLCHAHKYRGQTIACKKSFAFFHSRQEFDPITKPIVLSRFSLRSRLMTSPVYPHSGSPHPIGYGSSQPIVYRINPAKNGLFQHQKSCSKLKLLLNKGLIMLDIITGVRSSWSLYDGIDHSAHLVLVMVQTVRSRR